MPAMWPKFIPDLADTITSQQFTKPGGAILSYPLPSVGTDQVPIFPPGGDLIKSITPGNPLNAQLTTNPAAMINAINVAPLSGRYDFGKAVAQHYIDAVKNNAMTPFGAMHTNNGLAELILKEGYGICFERLLKEGDIPMMDQYDEDGNLTQMGKESHPAYADFCPDVAAPPTPEEMAEMQKENDIAFNKFTSADENKTGYNLRKFKFYQFPCLVGTETQQELEVIFATRILMGYKFMQTQASRWDYFVWACHLGKENYGNNYLSLSGKARNGIVSAGYNSGSLCDNVSKFVKDSILAMHPERGGDGSQLGINSVIKKRIYRTATKEVEYPTLQNSRGVDVTPEFCPINQYKLQVAYDFEQDSQRPKILKSNVVAHFTYYPNKRTGTPYVTDNKTCLFGNDGYGGSSFLVKYTKTVSWVKNKYEDFEWKQHWIKVPEAKLRAASTKEDAQAEYFKIDPKPEGTLFKFEFHKAVCAKNAASGCEEDAAVIDHPFEGSGTTPGGKSFEGDPYEMMAKVTIAYWYACIVKPFGPMPAALPAMINAPLGGLYIPIYYGSANRLANNLRKAWSTGKTFSVIPALQPPALATSAAVAGAYALHLLEFKLLYLGGIPTPVGPVPMVGFVPVVF